MANPSDAAAIRVSSPIVFTIAVLLGIAASFFVPTPMFTFPGYRVVGWGLITLGVLVGLAAVATLRRADTGIIPGRPSTKLVISGPYRFTRNPIYVAETLLGLGIALLLHSLWAALLLALVLLLLRQTAIIPEEAYLTRLFGEDYVRYMNSVRRWL